MFNMLHKLMAIVSRTFRQQGRFLRRQVFDLALTLMIIGGGMLLFLAAMISGGMTAYNVLLPVTGPAGALAIITSVLFIASLVMGVIGYRIQVKSDDVASFHERRQRGHNAMDDRYADSYKDRDEEEMAYAQALAKMQMREYDGRPGGRPARGGPSAEPYTHTPPAGAMGLNEMELAKEYIAMTHEQLSKKLDIVRRNPVTSVGVAMGLGLILGRSKSLRFVAKSAVLMGGKLLVDRYISGRKN